MGYYFQNISISSSNAGKFVSPFNCHLLNPFKKDTPKDLPTDKEDDIPIYVQLSHHYIEFYYEDYQLEHPVSPHQKKIILYLPIDEPLKLSFNLLNLPPILNAVLKSKSGKNGYSLVYGNIIPNKELLEIPETPEGHTLHELLLCFFNDLNNSKSELNRYNPELSECIREKLKRSEVYNLIIKKYKIFYDIYAYLQSNSTEFKKQEARISYNIYLDEVIKGKIKELVQGNRMNEDNWFDTPAHELEILSTLHQKYNIDKERQEDIQKALLTKHEVIKALKVTATHSFIPITANIIAFFIYLGVFFYWLGGHYSNSNWLLVSGFIIMGIGMIFHTIQQGFKLSLFLPRIVVSIATGWFLLIASEEILKNQITIEKIIIIIGLPLIFSLLYVFIYAEIRQHSPFYMHKKKPRLFWKTALIIIYSFNISVSIGLLAHPLVVDNYIQKSGVYENFIYNDERDNLEMLRVSSINYSNKLLSVQISNSLALLTTQQKVLKSNLSYLSDSLRIMSTNKSESLDSIQLKIFIATYNQKARSIEKKSLDSIFVKYLESQSAELSPIEFSLDTLNVDYSKGIKSNLNEILLNTSKNDLKLSLLTKKIDLITVNLGKQIVNLSNVNYLMSLHTFDESNACKPISPENIQRYAFRFSNWNYYIYPFMLIFQTLLVLLLAIVGQLIISDKTITEAL